MTGQCHCGAVRYDAEVDLSKPVIECNCSYCEKQGLLLSFAPGTSLVITHGDDNLTEYHFNTGKIAHLFCKTCGVQCFGRSQMESGPGAAINVRTLDGIELSTLTRMPFDGRSR
ncbi:MAG TPA: GFA family protein [Candidatus Paceibacterota bacterium]|nr:GFA family protein [Candidatus Paceibacterota bacterium]